MEASLAAEHCICAPAALVRGSGGFVFSNTGFEPGAGQGANPLHAPADCFFTRQRRNSRAART